MKTPTDTTQTTIKHFFTYINWLSYDKAVLMSYDRVLEDFLNLKTRIDLSDKATSKNVLQDEIPMSWTALRKTHELRQTNTDGEEGFGPEVYTVW